MNDESIIEIDPRYFRPTADPSSKGNAKKF